MRMALPKKKKRLPETPKADPGSTAPDVFENLKGPAPGQEGSPAMNDQMEKAFEMVDTIEQIHPLPEVAASGQSSTPQFNESKNPENVRINFSLKTPHEEQKNGAAIPVISIKLKIPSFLWKVPVISGVTRNIIRKLTQE
jgi:hypothetical protein